MRGRLGLLAGLAAGYVLGAKAGQERYEEIRDRFNKLMGTEQAQQLQAQVRTAAERAGQVMEEKAADGVSKVSEMAGGGSSSSSGTTRNSGNDVVLPPT